MKLKSMKSMPIVGGVQMGHIHINTKNHASSGVKADMPVGGVNMAKLSAKRFNAKRMATKSLFGGK